MSMRTLEGKRVLITGAASGIGMATARLFAENGASVVIADIADQAGEALAEELGPKHYYQHLDVVSPDQWASAMARARSEWGGLDLVFLNAGVMTRPAGAPILDDPFNWLSPENLDKILRINVRGVVCGVTESLPVLADGNDPTILVAGSIAGIAYSAQDPLYSLSKHAVVGFVRAMAPNLARQSIRIAAVCPVGVDTEMTPPDLREFKRREGIAAPNAEHMARAVCEIYLRAGNGEVWVGGGPELAYRHDYAPLRGGGPA